MRARSSWTVAALGALAVAWSGVAAAGSAAGIAAMLPILLLLAPLLARRYPGEARIARLRSARGHAVALPRARNARPPRPARRAFARGSLLLGRGLAVRPPPLLPAHA